VTPRTPQLVHRSPTAWAPGRVDPKPEGRARQAQQLDLDGGEGTRCDSQPRPGTIIEEQDIYFRASALLEGEQNNLPLACSEQAVARPTLNLARLPANPHGMLNLGLPGALAEEADEGGGARATADGRWRTPRARRFRRS
jgi:hypothetical protein